MTIKPELQKKLDDSLKLLNSAEALLNASQKQSETVSKVTENAVKALRSVKVDAPSLASVGWSKDAQKSSATPAEVAAIKNAENKGTRVACQAALKVITPNKKLSAIVDRINKLLQKDSELAAKINALSDKAGHLDATMKTVGKSLS